MIIYNFETHDKTTNQLYPKIPKKVGGGKFEETEALRGKQNCIFESDRKLTCRARQKVCPHI